MRLHVFVIGWTGWERSCEHIATMVLPHVERLTVVYSNSGEKDYEGVGEIVRVPDDWFYGRKFEECLRRFDGDVMLQIQADATLDEAGWGRLIERCRFAFDKYERIGVWAPEVDYTPWDSDIVTISESDDDNIKYVAQTDGIVWALSGAVVARLKNMDFRENNLGWGLDWASIAYSLSNNLLILRDLSVCVNHPKGSGYLGEHAERQMKEFLTQLTEQEWVQYVLLKEMIENRNAKRWVDKRTIGQKLLSKIFAITGR